jgi:hypothetical protein
MLHIFLTTYLTVLVVELVGDKTIYSVASLGMRLSEKQVFIGISPHSPQRCSLPWLWAACSHLLPRFHCDRERSHSSADGWRVVEKKSRDCTQSCISGRFRKSFTRLFNHLLLRMGRPRPDRSCDPGIAVPAACAGLDRWNDGSGHEGSRSDRAGERRPQIPSKSNRTGIGGCNCHHDGHLFPSDLPSLSGSPRNDLVIPIATQHFWSGCLAGPGCVCFSEGESLASGMDRDSVRFPSGLQPRRSRPQ